MSPLVYAPDGTPYDVPTGEVNSFIRKGYKTTKPEEPNKTLVPVMDTTSTGGVSGESVIATDEVTALKEPVTGLHQASDVMPSLGEADGAWANTTEGKIKINEASLKDLVGLPGIGTAIAKKIIEHRPYKSAEDLIAKVPLPSGDWLALGERISY